MRTTRLAIVGIAAALGLVLASTLLADPRPAPPTAGFQNKIALVLRADEPGVGYALRNPSTITLNDQGFLVGVIVDPGDDVDWRIGRRIWIPVEAIGEIVEFADTKSYRATLVDLSQAE
jgi:hypothetical protein